MSDRRTPSTAASLWVEMRPYDPKLTRRARSLRIAQTDAELALWRRVRRRQILGVRFYRQKPIGGFIVDFFAPRVGLVVEIDGGQHWHHENAAKDRLRETALRSMGLRVLRYSNRDVLARIDAVVTEIWTHAARELELGKPW